MSFDNAIMYRRFVRGELNSTNATSGTCIAAGITPGNGGSGGLILYLVNILNFLFL
jgi:hypothetical protein